MKAALVLVCAAAAIGAPDSIDVAVAARSIQPGELVVLTITTPAGVDRVKVRAFNRDLPAFNAGERMWRALVGIDLDVVAGTYPVTIDAHTGNTLLHTTQDLDVGPHKFPTRTLRVEEIEVGNASSWVGKTLAQIDLRTAYNLLPMAVKRTGAATEGHYQVNPPDSLTLEKGMVLIVIGDVKDLHRVRQQTA